MHAIESYTVDKKQLAKNSYRIEKIDSVARIESNRIETFLPELECSNTDPSLAFQSGI